MSYLDRVVDNEYCTLILETADNGDVHAHLNVYQWSKGAYDVLLGTWVDVLAALRKKDIHKVYATAPVDEENEKTLRFQMMFGFTPVSVLEWPDTDKKYYLSEVNF